MNGVATGAAAVLLVAAPGAVPGLVGLLATPASNLFGYLLAASELAIAVMCGHAVMANNRKLDIQAVVVLVTLHLGSAAAMTMATAGNAVLLLNTLIRVLVATALIACASPFRNR